jgi:hypothetical protein
MVVRAIPVVESAPVSGGAPLLRQSEGGPGSGRHPEGGNHEKVLKQHGWYPVGTGRYYHGSHGGSIIVDQYGWGHKDDFERGSGKDTSSLKSYLKNLDENPQPRGRASEVTPPGYENIVKGLKKHGNVDNPWAVAWSMKNKGIKPKTSEAAPVASGVCHDEADAGCQCPDCAKKQEDMGVPSSLIHDETGKVPVKSFRDDIKRKVNLRKVMGKHEPDPEDGPVHTAEAVPSSFNDDPAGMDDTSDLDLGMLDPDDNEEIPSGDDQMWTKEQVNYRYSGDKFESCGNCVHFKFPGSCDIIAGPVRPVDVCDKFEAEDDDKGAPFGWQGQQQTEDEDTHSVDDQTVPSTLVPLRDKNVVQAVVAEGGPASAWGMVTHEGGPGSGRAPAGIHVNGVQNFPGKEPHVVFTDKITKSTMMIPQSQATPENMQNKAVAKRREFYGDPTERRQAMKKTASESGAVKNLAQRLLEGGPGSGRHPYGGGTKQSGKYDAVLDKHGFNHVSSEDKLSRFSKDPQHGYTQHVFQNPDHGKSSVVVRDHNDGKSDWFQYHEQPNGIMAPTTGETKPSLDKILTHHYGEPKGKNVTSESAAIKSLAKRLAETAFDTLKGKLARKKGVTSPGGLAAYIGRKKYGKAGMAKKAAAGRRKTTEAPGEFMPVGPGKTAGDASGKMAYEPTQRNKKYKGFRDSGKSIAPEA